MTATATNVAAIRPHSVALYALQDRERAFRDRLHEQPHVPVLDAARAYWAQQLLSPPAGVDADLWRKLVDCQIQTVTAEPEFSYSLLESMVRSELTEIAYDLKKARMYLNTLRPSTSPTWAYEMADLSLAANELVAEISSQSGAGVRAGVAGTAAACGND